MAPDRPIPRPWREAGSALAGLGRTGKREGSALRTRQEALPPGPPAKGEALCNLSIGWCSEEGQP